MGLLLRKAIFDQAPRTMAQRLRAACIAAYRLEENSGDRADSTPNATTLTDNNTVTSNTGKIGTAGQFTAASSEYLSSTSSIFNRGDTSWTQTCWVYADTLPALSVISGKDNGAADRAYLLYHQIVATNSRFRVAVMDGGSTAWIAVADTFGVPSTATWYFLAAGHDAVANEVWISVNNGALDTTATSAGAGDSAASFMMGSLNALATTFWDGRIDAWHFFNKRLSGAELTYLYNSGNGREYPFA